MRGLDAGNMNWRQCIKLVKYIKKSRNLAPNLTLCLVDIRVMNMRGAQATVCVALTLERTLWLPAQPWMVLSCIRCGHFDYGQVWKWVLAYPPGGGRVVCSACAQLRHHDMRPGEAMRQHILCHFQIYEIMACVIV
jgi:hypothetical protein